MTKHKSMAKNKSQTWFLNHFNFIKIMQANNRIHYFIGQQNTPEKC